MGRKFWARGYTLFGDDVPLANSPAGTLFNLLEVPGPSSPDATLLRIFLDVRLSLWWREASTRVLAPDWWSWVQVMVAAGVRGNGAEGVIRPFGDEDPRVTLTGGLAVTPALTSSDNVRASAVWQNTTVLESQGARKSLFAGQPPVAAASMYIADNTNILAAPANDLFMGGYAYMRVLYEDPT